MSDKQKETIETLNYMADKGYFKIQEEYDKSVDFVQRNIIPSWLINDIEKYANQKKEEETINEKL